MGLAWFPPSRGLVGEYESLPALGLVGEYDGLVGLNAGLAGEYPFCTALGLVGEICAPGLLGLYCGLLGL